MLSRGILFNNIPDPIIVSEEEELPLQRAPSGQLVLELFRWLIGVVALIYTIYRIWWYWH